MKRMVDMNDTDDRASKWVLFKTLMLALLVISLHILAVVGFFTIQGCGTMRREPVMVEPAPPPPMPPRATTPRPPPRAQPARLPRTAPHAPPAPAPVDHETYTVRTGDSLSVIAQRFGVHTRELADLNNISNLDVVRVGQKLKLPLHARERDTVETPAPRARRTETAPPVDAGEVYEVQPGDVLSRIAVRHGTTVQALRELNDLTSDRILVGQKLKIPKTDAPRTERPQTPTERPAPPREETREEPAPEQPAPAPIVPEEVLIERDRSDAPPRPGTTEQQTVQTYPYRVRENDTIENLAMLFHVTREELAAANNMSPDDSLEPGSTLRVPIP